MDDKITLCWRCFRTRGYAKRQFPKDVLRRVAQIILDSLLENIVTLIVKGRLQNNQLVFRLKDNR